MEKIEIVEKIKERIKIIDRFSTPEFEDGFNYCKEMIIKLLEENDDKGRSTTRN